MVSEPSSFEQLFWEELCRREVWDRDFERSIVEEELEKNVIDERKKEEGEESDSRTTARIRSELTALVQREVEGLGRRVLGRDHS